MLTAFVIHIGQIRGELGVLDACSVSSPPVQH